MRVINDLISRQEAAHMLDCHLQTINNYIRRGLLTRYHHPNGHNVFLDRKEVEALLQPKPE